jgi:hypothetical protein
MGLVHTVGVGILDYTGVKKSMAIYVPATVALATVQTEMNTFLPAIDAVIDGKIEDAQITIGLTLPGGMKGSAAAGNTVREGALLKYNAAATAFTFGLYVPSWANAGFAGNTPLTSGIYATAEGALVIFGSDRDANAITAYLSGKRAFRK